MRLLVALSVAALLLTASPLCAQHLGARVHWQPAISETDSRLQQPVEIEILGRAAIPALKLLSDATGVSLTVAPEDLTTVGERKLTVISKGLTLKAIMVQLPEALQECHWDIDASGEEPVYLLHRNGSVETMVEEQRADRRSELRARYRAERTERLEFVRQALALSDEELRDLEQTDLLLALALQDPFWRGNIEAFFALPRDLMQETIEGRSYAGRFCYGGAPEQVQRSVDRILERHTPQEDHPAARHWQEQLPRLREAEVTYRIHPDGAVILICQAPLCFQLIIPPKNGYVPGPLGYSHQLLGEIGGMTEQEAARLGAQWEADRQREERANEEARRQAREALRPPSESPLHRPYTIPCSDRMPLVAFLRDVSQLTELSVVSDSFGGDWLRVAGDMRGEMPLWILLMRLSDHRIESEVAGDCLVFHHTHWYGLSQEPADTERNDIDITIPQQAAETGRQVPSPE